MAEEVESGALTAARVRKRFVEQGLEAARYPRQADAGGTGLAWKHTRNRRRCKVDWRFTAADARIKLKRLYPSVDA